MAKKRSSPTTPNRDKHECDQCVAVPVEATQGRAASAPVGGWDFWDRQINLLVNLSWSQLLRLMLVVGFLAAIVLLWNAQIPFQQMWDAARSMSITAWVTGGGTFTVVGGGMWWCRNLKNRNKVALQQVSSE